MEIHAAYSAKFVRQTDLVRRIRKLVKLRGEWPKPHPDDLCAKSTTTRLRCQTNAPRPPADAQAGCIATLGLALLPILYVGSFVYLVADSELNWGLWASLDDAEASMVEAFYRPLIWSANRIGLLGWIGR